jgi:hypothetical protein
MRAYAMAAIVVLLLQPFGVPVATGEGMPPGCRLEDDDPLRAEVNRMMAEGAEFELRQKAALREKVSRLGRARGWSQAEEDAYLKAVVMRGNDQAWGQTLEVAAAFMRVCQEQTDGSQRAEAVRLFRQLYDVEEKQWRWIQDSVERDIAEAEKEPQS